ncbi:N,N'-diacetyllegionaminic acid synthase [Stieleria maiorica]|uniref:N,N'-diacetyllegionaminic acid synthase n=1 Tax=Stieleria maiorica TaxID=2795974 RepID=A0A5B9MFM9_9BACT|nr:N-acetylneuraminate synthase family protein [Stieleria maiorica]QEF99643.1 N,N'-diacetyllegionaminic acid synthase [Stieleria maiorica]
MKSFHHLDRPFVIAEIGGNHEGDFNYAIKLLNDAVEAGADAVKFQTYTPDRIVSKVESPERHRHFGKFALTSDQYVTLAHECHERNVQFMSSLWDLESIEVLDRFISVHKVGSGDLTNYPLLKRLVETRKPLCIATAMSNLGEVQETVDFLDSIDPTLIPEGRLCVMHCVAMYGDSLDEYTNLRAIETMRDALDDRIVMGYSDHTTGNVAVKAAVCMGARVIETHFTDDNSREFRDHHFAHTKESLADFIEFCARREAMLGDGVKRPVHRVETPRRIWEFRRACYFKQDMCAGDVASLDNLTTLRPHEGIDARNYFDLIGKKLVRDIKAFERLRWDDFEGAS